MEECKGQKISSALLVSCLKRYTEWNRRVDLDGIIKHFM